MTAPLAPTPRPTTTTSDHGRTLTMPLLEARNLRKTYRLGRRNSIAALRGAFLVSTAVAARIGTVALAAHQIAFEIWSFLALTLDAVAIAGHAAALRDRDAKAILAAAHQFVHQRHHVRNCAHCGQSQGTQQEVHSIQKTADGTYVLTEGGPNPRLLELGKTFGRAGRRALPSVLRRRAPRGVHRRCDGVAAGLGGRQEEGHRHHHGGPGERRSARRPDSVQARA